MENIVGGVFPNQEDEDFKLDKNAMFMPITVCGIPIGFISGVTDKQVGVCLWTENWSIKRDSNGKVLGVEIILPKEDEKETQEFDPSIFE